MTASLVAKGSTGMAQQGPLSGITIVDLSRILAGPYCTMLMAELLPPLPLKWVSELLSAVRS